MFFHEWSLDLSRAKEEEEATGGVDDGRQHQQQQRMPPISFHSIKYGEKSVYMWIGDGHSTLNNLCGAVQTPFDTRPSCVNLLSNDETEASALVSSNLASKLAKRLGSGKQVLVAFNVSMNGVDELAQQKLVFAVEKRIVDEIKANPHLF